MGKKYPVKNLASVCLKITDGSHFSPDLVERGYPYITVRDINDDKIDFSNCKFVSKKDYETLKNNGCAPKYGDLLFSKDGTVGKVAIVDTNKQFVVLSSLAIITPDETQISSEFLFYVLKSPAFLKEAIGRKTGAAIRRIILKHLKTIEIPIPPLPVQKAIVAKLDAAFASIDTAIAAAEKNAENVKQLFQSYLSDIFENRGKHRNDRQAAVMETRLLGDICDVLDSKRKPITKHDRVPGPIPYYGATGIVDYVKNYIFDEKLVLIGEDGAKWAAGENTAFSVSGKTWVNNHAHVIRPHRDKVCDEWIVYYLTGKDLSEYVTGLTVPKLNQAQLRSIPIPLPPLPVQKAIVAKLDEITLQKTKLVEICTSKRKAFIALKQSLLQQAFSGQLVDA